MLTEQGFHLRPVLQPIIQVGHGAGQWVGNAKVPWRMPI